MKTTIALALFALTGIASAGDPAGKAATPPAKDAKAAMPKPPQELADMAKQTSGTWKCEGQVFMDPKDPTKGSPAKATVTMKSDLDNWWVHTTLAGTGGFPLKFDAYTTYDANQKKWYRFGADNMGGFRNESTSGPNAGKIVWEGDARSPMGSAKVRETEEVAKDNFKTTGEMSMDGKTWVKTHEVTCKK